MTATTERKRLSRQESQVQTRERLLDAGRKLFIRQGFGGTSLRDIAEDAGYSQGAFYSNFASKEAVLLELLARQIDLNDAHLCAIVEKEGQTVEDILVEIEAWLQGLVDDRDLSILTIEIQLHALRSPAFAESFAKVWQEHLQQGAVMLTRICARLGKRPPSPPEQVVAGLIALANGLSVQDCVLHTPRIAQTATLFLRAIIASAPQEAT
jgi:AcrR family transcriptional regulator